MKKPKILAVDDKPANLLALEAVLERDFELLRAGSGPEAIALAEAHADIDVILMDVEMPAMDGYETARRIKRIATCAEIPVVFITAVYKENDYVKRGYEVGGLDYFTKPFDPDLLRMKMAVYASFRQKAAVLEERARQLRETEELMRVGRKLSAVLESLPMGVLISDVQGRICQANDEIARICESSERGWSDTYGAVLGWWDSSGQMIKDSGGPLSRALERRESTRNQPMRIRCVDGSVKPVLASASPLLGLAGEVVGAVVLIQDVTERERIAGEMEERVARLISLGVELEQSVAR